MKSKLKFYLKFTTSPDWRSVVFVGAGLIKFNLNPVRVKVQDKLGKSKLSKSILRRASSSRTHSCEIK